MQGQQLELFHQDSPIGEAPSETSSLGLSLQEPRPHQSRSRWGWILLAITLLASGGYLFLPRQTHAEAEQQTAESRPASRPLAVEVIEAEPVSSYSVRREYTGTVQAARASELGFERSGKLVQLIVQEGETVRAGQAIAQLDIRNLQAQRQLLQAQKAGAEAVLQELENGPRQEAIAAAKSRVAELQDQLALEQARRTRREDLYRQGAIAREELDEIAFGQDALSDRLAASRSQLQELETGTRPEQVMAQQATIAQLDAQIADLDITIEKSTLLAPYSGTISDRRLDEGTVVSAGQGVVRLVEGASPEVEIGVPEDVTQNLILGERQAVEIGGTVYDAELTAIKPEVDAATRTRPLVLQLEPAALKAVAPQQIAQLTLTQTVPMEGYWLPLTALARGDRGLWAAYAVVEASKEASEVSAKTEQALQVERRDVEVLYTEGERALVRGTLETGDRLVKSGIQRIVPGQQVELAQN